jgi:hypothetical protein
MALGWPQGRRYVNSADRSAASLGPSSEDVGLTTAQYGIDQALSGLALWCPHGLDTSRVSDYQNAKEARDLLVKAQNIIGKPGQQPW